jgi:hypothetical protein
MTTYLNDSGICVGNWGEMNPVLCTYSHPPIAAKHALMAKAVTLNRTTFTPDDLAAISDSRIAVNARPHRDRTMLRTARNSTTKIASVMK